MAGRIPYRQSIIYRGRTGSVRLLTCRFERENNKSERQMTDIENSIYIIGITRMLRPCIEAAHCALLRGKMCI